MATIKKAERISGNRVPKLRAQKQDLGNKIVLGDELSEFITSLIVDGGGKIDPEVLIFKALDSFMFLIEQIKIGNQIYIQEQGANGRPKLTKVIVDGVNDELRRQYREIEEVTDDDADPAAS